MSVDSKRQRWVCLSALAVRPRGFDLVRFLNDTPKRAKDVILVEEATIAGAEDRRGQQSVGRSCSAPILHLPTVPFTPQATVRTCPTIQISASRSASSTARRKPTYGPDSPRAAPAIRFANSLLQSANLFAASRQANRLAAGCFAAYGDLAATVCSKQFSVNGLRKTGWRFHLTNPRIPHADGSLQSLTAFEGLPVRCERRQETASLVDAGHPADSKPAVGHNVNSEPGSPAPANRRQRFAANGLLSAVYGKLGR
jgi:hypothetical protein